MPPFILGRLDVVGAFHFSIIPFFWWKFDPSVVQCCTVLTCCCFVVVFVVDIGASGSIMLLSIPLDVIRNDALCGLLPWTHMYTNEHLSQYLLPCHKAPSTADLHHMIWMLLHNQSDQPHWLIKTSSNRLKTSTIFAHLKVITVCDSWVVGSSLPARKCSAMLKHTVALPL